MTWPSSRSATLRTDERARPMSGVTPDDARRRWPLSRIVGVAVLALLLFSVGFVPTVLLPQATERHVRGERTRYALAMCVGILFAISIAGLIALKFFGIVLLHALAGHAFDAAEPLLMPYSIAMMFLATSTVLGSYGIATHRIAFAAPLIVGAAGTLLAIVLAHASLMQVVNVIAVGNALTAVAVAAALGWQALHGHRAATSSPG